ncbi:MAG: anhydro-N-acetylmuramic acid kinase [Cyclobacteriaceae bacterium]|nr:anhydro-N-acetylmuramic acid kinase [Cyclobacteriaceae bacterium]
MKKYDVIGMMSGTSLDGLDIAFVRFSYKSDWQFEVLGCKTVEYDDAWKRQLQCAGELNAFELKELDLRYGTWLGEQARGFMNAINIQPALIVSHGHTIFHRPQCGITLQIGDGYNIMQQTQLKTICDLRSLDIALGGQGAPLVPIGDELLFYEYDLCLNLGGFSNISFKQKSKRTAFDICPVNTVLNYLASKKGFEYDHEGTMARAGHADMSLFKQLNALKFYGDTPPKSLGMEWVTEHILPLLKEETPENLLHTFCHHVAYQISLTIASHYSKYPISHKPKMLVTGGGAKNTFLIELIASYANGKIEMHIPDDELIDFKEAIIFAFLGLLRSLGKINTLSSVTGAKSDSSGGLVYEPLYRN